ncbi:hypothetical protein ACJ2CR_35410 [Myxococcus faecalis]|uniref:hypothetical protein n=1 Tax=Myxococcus TaxID=32 RepID=UPI001143FE06|nr:MULTISPECIES: hypothetical protein [Myxococcus]MBZ4410295.1 hypothetical protein [Myxococcus sp. XM-1-1-1]MCK8504124.1 hypothetical protein [Myxococcus fulvus]
MTTLKEWGLAVLPFTALVLLWRFSVSREKRQTQPLYRAVDEGAVGEVQAILSKQAFPNLRSVVVASAVVRAVEARQLAVLDFLLSPELKPVSLTQKLDAFLHEQAMKGGWRGVVLWRARRSPLFLPWRDLSKKDKLRLRSLATRGVEAEPAKVMLRHDVRGWTLA